YTRVFRSLIWLFHDLLLHAAGHTFGRQAIPPEAVPSGGRQGSVDTHITFFIPLPSSWLPLPPSPTHETSAQGGHVGRTTYRFATTHQPVTRSNSYTRARFNTYPIQHPSQISTPTRTERDPDSSGQRGPLSETVGICIFTI